MPQVVITLTQTETGGTADVSGDMPLSPEQREYLGNVALNAVMLAATGVPGGESAPPPSEEPPPGGFPYAGDTHEGDGSGGGDGYAGGE